MRTLVKIGVLLSAALVGCSAGRICYRLPDDPECALTIQDAKINNVSLVDAMIKELSKRDTHTLIAHITGGPDTAAPLSLRIVQTGMPPVELNYSGGIEPDYIYKALISPEIAKKFRTGDARVEISDPKIQGPSTSYPVKWTLPIIPYSSVAEISLANQSAAANADIEHVGMAGGILYALGTGTTSTKPSKKVHKYEFTAISPAFVGLTDSNLSNAILTDRQPLLLSVAGQNAYLSHNLDMQTSGVSWYPVQKQPLVFPNDVHPLNFTLPTDTQAMLVTGDASRMIVADGQGALSWGALPGPVGTWQQVGGTGSGVRLAVTDMNFDGKDDLLAVWVSTGRPKAAVYLATAAGFTPADEVFSAQLTNALGTEPITALAAGDVDRDGYGDVVVARGTQLILLQSQLNRFEAFLLTSVEPAGGGGTKIDAIALGRLDATRPDSAQLDIVTASNTGYGMMGNTMYLHAFRPMP